MNKLSTSLGLLFVVTAMTGCDITSAAVNQVVFTSYGSLSDEYERIQTADGGTALTAPSALPTAGSAAYDGVINIIVQDGPLATDVLLSAVGNLELDVDFDDVFGSASASAYNFYRDDGTDAGVSVNGAGTFDGAINRAAVPGVTDTFVLGSGSGFDLDGNELVGTLSGNFRDQSAPGAIPDGATGTVVGTVTSGPGSSFRGTWVVQ